MKKILLIEDDQDLISLYKEILKDNYEVLVAETGNGGLKAVREEPDLILLDILLPDINGFEVLKKLRNDEETKEIPVIILTNLGDKKVDDNQTMAMSLGAQDYLIKTYHDPDEILNKISAYLK